MAAKIETGRSIIRISRDGNIEESAEVAIRILDLFHHVPGQMVMIEYYTDGTKTAIDNMVAIGLKEGVGTDCYQIITPFHKTIIWGVAKTYSEVDAAQFPTGREVYISLIPERNKPEYVTLVNGERTFTPITDGPRAYEDISTRRTFYLDVYNWSGGGGGGEIDPEEVKVIVHTVVDQPFELINQSITNLQADLSGKVDKDQGVANAGKYLTIGANGKVQATEFSLEWIEN